MHRINKHENRKGERKGGGQKLGRTDARDEDWAWKKMRQGR